MHSSQVQHNEKAPVRNGRDHRVNDRADNMGTRPGRVQLNEKAPADESSRHITGRHDQSGPHHLSQVQHNENALGGNGHGLRKQVNATNVTTSLDRVQLNEKALAATKPRTKGNELSRGQRNENARTTHTMKPQCPQSVGFIISGVLSTSEIRKRRPRRSFPSVTASNRSCANTHAQEKPIPNT